jgi:hypothetical protein
MTVERASENRRKNFFVAKIIFDPTHTIGPQDRCKADRWDSQIDKRADKRADQEKMQS